MSDSNRDDGSSRALNLPLLTKVPAPLPNPKPEKPGKFDGTEFKRWQQKMLFYLTTLHLVKFLQEDPPEPGTDQDSVLAVDAWTQGDFLCRNYILNGLDDSLYNVYSPIPTAKKLWASLDKKYKTEDAGTKKFVVGRFLEYKMVDSKTVISQVQEFQLILHEIEAEGMILPETFQVATIVEKLPPAWRDFKNYLKHKRKELKLEDLIVRLRIEEDNRKSEKRSNKNSYEAKANVIEDSKGKASTSKGLKRKKTTQGYKGKNQEGKNKRFNGTCYICNKEGHKANECRSRLKKNKKDHP